MNDRIIEIIKQDIERCENQNTDYGSCQLYQTLIGKYNGLFKGFSDDIPVPGKVTARGAFDFRPELNAIKEKLELLLITEQTKDPLFKFKKMLSDDIEQIKSILEFDGIDEESKRQLYASITAKYHPYIPKLGQGLYEYNASLEFYDEVTGDSLEYNLRQMRDKLLTFQSLNYPGLGETIANTPNTVVTITNTNQNENTMTVSFDAAREAVNGMTSLPDEDIEEIQNKINTIEEIVNSEDSKSKKWSKSKEIIKWIADKGVDVGIALLPLLLKIG